jgi:hypothetical protein
LEGAQAWARRKKCSIIKGKQKGGEFEGRDMAEVNVLVTARKGRERTLLRFLNPFGEFKGSGFRDVILGRVKGAESFLDDLEKLRRESPRRLGNKTRMDRVFFLMKS